MRQILACLIALIALAAPAAAQPGYLAGGPDGDRPDYRGGGGDAPPGTIEIWDGESWRPYAYCQSNPCGGYNADRYRRDERRSTNVQTYAHLEGRDYTYADCPAGTEPSVGDDGERICLRRSGRVTTRDDLPRHAPRYEERGGYRETYDERRYSYRDEASYRHRETYRPPASPCETRQRDWSGCYQSREWTDYRRTESRGDIDLRVYPREWYGQDGRYWREVPGSGGRSGCACEGYSRDRHYSECGHYDHTTHYDGGYGYYDDGLAWSYFGARSGAYYGTAGGGGYHRELVLPSAGARARAFAGAGAGAGASANANVSVNTRVNTGVHVRVGGGGGWRGGHGGGGCRSGCGHGGGHH
ncbi:MULTISPECIES: hypothetical protein [Hyphobacterium]|uniref:Uncharacterized protein n=1 Tax=Hyphobacterium vulgare TaxID=1736751 RepID=A0ABV6ZY15_9PROT